MTVQIRGDRLLPYAVADPGFPVGGGVDLVGGGMDSRRGYVSKILYVKTKESGPLGGGRAPDTSPRSANDMYILQLRNEVMILNT